jgi:hypothetical protein
MREMHVSRCRRAPEPENPPPASLQHYAMPTPPKQSNPLAQRTSAGRLGVRGKM